ncbi:MAG: energy transducer TonB [Bacteroidales bacterium]
MKILVKTYMIASFALTFVFIISVKVPAQSKSQTDNSLEVTEDTVFFDLPNEDVWIIMDQPPQFPGGDSALISYITNNTIYPQTAINDSITGKVFTLFVVNIDGSTDNVQILRGVRSDINSECIRVIKEMPTWKPGEVIREAQKGYYWAKMRMPYSIRFSFTLDTISTPNERIIIRPKMSTNKIP